MNKKALLVVILLICVSICTAVLDGCLNLIRYGSLNKPKEVVEHQKQGYSNNKNSSVGGNAETSKTSEEGASSSSNSLSHIKVKIIG